jgi:predicted acylesterase/phospholipase RssA
MRQYLQNFIGTSAGAIICFFLVLEYTSSEIRDFIFEQSESSVITDIICIDNIIETMGLVSGQMAVSNGNNITKLFQNILLKKTNKLDITFIDLAKTYGKNLVICASNITQETYEFFSVDTTPEMSVIDALRMSCSIPLLFSPVSWNNSLYVDGGLYCNFPLLYFEHELKNNSIRDVLGICVKNKNGGQFNTIFQYTMFLINSLLSKFNEAQVENIIHKTSKCNVITLEIEDTPLISIDTLKMTFPLDVIDSLILQGYTHLQTSLQQHVSH